MNSFTHADYSKWERAETQKHSLNDKKGKVSNTDLVKDYSDRDQISPSRVGSSCSLSKCRHPWNNYRAVESANAARELQKARIKEINVRVKHYEQSLLELKSREANLITRNMKLFREIENHDKTSFGKVGTYLNQYDRSKDGIMRLQERFEKEKFALETELKETGKMIKDKLSGLRAYLKTITEQVDSIQEELGILNNYKDKIYPERLLLIHSLKQRIVSIKMNNEEHEAELLEIIQSEHAKLVEQNSVAVAAMQDKVANKASAEVHPSIIDMAKENQKLRSDIQFHQQQMQLLREDIQFLKLSNRTMTLDPDASLSKSLFPQVYQKQSKCLPEDDFVLDIPTRRLPVI